MLADLTHQRQTAYRSLPILGGSLDEFEDWMIAQGYRHGTRQLYIERCKVIDRYLHQRRYSLESLTYVQLRQCFRYFRQRAHWIASAVGCLKRFLLSKNKIVPIARITPFDRLLASYRDYMTNVRGLAPSSVDSHNRTVIEFLHYLHRGRRTFTVANLKPHHVDGFIRSVSGRLGRESLQHVACAIRAFIRFLKLKEHVPAGPDFVIYKPRIYRGEQLPRTLPWETVLAFLKSFDHDAGAGRRDYAMFLLIATYGLRACDIAGLKLDDIDWRRGVMHLRQQKTRSPLELPLTRPVAAALLAYLRKGRPRTSQRGLFFSAVAPIMPLKRQMVGYAFRHRVKAGDLEIPFKGAHCLRHSYALHLLRSGIALKTIGDLLGHTTMESTGVYLRVHTDDLGQIALPLPVATTGGTPS
jgi:integrase/recombinase XerD